MQVLFWRKSELNLNKFSPCLIYCPVIKIHTTNTADVVMGAWLHQFARQPQGTDSVHFGNFLLNGSKENRSTVYSLPMW